MIELTDLSKRYGDRAALHGLSVAVPSGRVTALIGPHAHLNGARIEDEVFVATGVSIFAGAVAGARSELRVGSVLHVNSHLPADSVVPIGWIAAGRPAQLFSPDRHDELWAVQEGLDSPRTMYGVPRGTSMREIMRRQSAAHGPPA